MRSNIDIIGHGFIALTLLLTVYGQLVLRWQMSKAGQLPPGVIDKLVFLLSQFGNPWIISGLVSAFVASLAWMAAMTRFDLAYAYPFMALSFILVMLFGLVFLGEPLAWTKVVGTCLVVAGLYVVTR